MFYDKAGGGGEDLLAVVEDWLAVGEGSRAGLPETNQRH